MKNSLLIHNNNVPFKNQFAKTIAFKPTGVDIDEYITHDIIPQIKKLNPQIIYIKDNLSSNYLELYGLRLVYHIRLSQELGVKRLLPIVLLSDLDSSLLNRLSSMGRVLFTKNIFIAKNSIEAVKKIDTLEIKPFKEELYEDEFLNLIEVEPPKDYLSHHDISNEWAIYRWAKFLKVDSEAIIKNREKIASMLYFKYLLAKNPIEIEKKNGIQFVPRPPEKSGKVLYIDDEWAKGWSDILKQYFSKNQNIEFKTFKHDFKDSYKYIIKSKAKKKCEEYEPDLVILDLRLSKSDHSQKEITKLTGIEIVKAIKNINPAIQIIMLTATGKSTILESLYEHGILGYIKKEHPHDVSISTKDNFDKLKKLVDKGLDKKYLKEVWEIQKKVLELHLPNEIQLEVKSIFELLDTDMENRFNYAMFAIVKSIEIITNIYTEEKWEDGKRYAYWKNSNDKISSNYGNTNDSTENKIRTILDEKLFLGDLNIHNSLQEIIKIRNNTIHPKQGSVEKITEDNILIWFKMLQTILEKIEQ